MTREDIETELAAMVAAKRLGLVTDIDGTISQIAPTPAEAVVTPKSLSLLSELVGKLPLVAVITGRSIGDARRMIDLPGLVYVGNHGLEEWHDGQSIIHPQAARFAHRIPEVLRAVQDRVNADGLLFDNKQVTASIHYRLTDDPAAVHDQIMAVVEPLSRMFNLTVTEGQMVIDIRPPLEIDKGTALERLVSRHKLTAAIYLGDDSTDADAFRTIHRLRAANVQGLGIGVVRPGTLSDVLETADWLVEEVSGVEQFLTDLNLRLSTRG